MGFIASGIRCHRVKDAVVAFAIASNIGKRKTAGAVLIHINAFEELGTVYVNFHSEALRKGIQCAHMAYRVVCFCDGMRPKINQRIVRCYKNGCKIVRFESLHHCNNRRRIGRRNVKKVCDLAIGDALGRSTVDQRDFVGFVADANRL